MATLSAAVEQERERERRRRGRKAAAAADADLEESRREAARPTGPQMVQLRKVSGAEK